MLFSANDQEAAPAGETVSGAVLNFRGLQRCCRCTSGKQIRCLRNPSHERRPPPEIFNLVTGPWSARSTGVRLSGATAPLVVQRSQENKAPKFSGSTGEELPESSDLAAVPDVD